MAEKRKPSARRPAAEKKKCEKCKQDKNRDREFYNSNSKCSDGKASICKECFEVLVEEYGFEFFIQFLQHVNRPYLSDEWIKWEENCGKYLKNVSSLPQYKDLSYSSSIEIPKSIVQKTETDIDQLLMEKWGEGYEPEEYRAFERKYATLSNNYQERTAMHTEALITYIRYRVKEELATARGDAREAKDWGALAKDAATAAKINPSQLSKSDLSDGLDGFGQLVRSVEQSVDIIEILPKFKERPQDSVDFNIWCYVNYVRDMKGLPSAEYSEIYQFYEERKKEYESMKQEADAYEK
ncbi:hypothetical protein PC41400_08015 [Paenibacillus chitinolyticus]|uniref:Uncharacterized protein n=1 Tax=Paenibacillus chitinolyticus TaxID=79263 RepID=A0A410WTE4_9BACL|nr:hypothetical protein [Paenibacillus chitinolyticus]MCY9594042.1 hypothetical protein [Paenibacillus chitinolyticus]MCY9599147.1 hypothetical protein [Paenibacillus chitinolyticus]QAV17612.1 hypothetical protein PC41400_08015 [Paenibacillus chitinolyticus]